MSRMEQIKLNIKDHTYSNEEDVLWDLAKWRLYES